jgi:nitric oxide reductase NorQ protein
MSAIHDLFDDLDQPTPTGARTWETDATRFHGFARLAPGPLTPSAGSVSAYVYDTKYDLDVRAFLNGWSLGLVGPTGTGKSSFVQWLAHQTGHELEEIVHNRHFESTDVFGEREQDETGRWIYGKGRLIEAYRNNRLIFLDEIASIPPSVAQLYHPFLRRSPVYARAADGSIERVEPGENTRLCAAWNPVHGHGGNHEIGFALLDRMLLVQFDALSLEKEIEAMRDAAPSIDQTLCRHLAEFAATWRQGQSASPDSVRYSISTRTLVDIVRLMDELDAPLEYCIKRKILDPVRLNFADELEAVVKILTSKLPGYAIKS